MEKYGKLSRKCHYEPEIFPGLIFRIEDPKVVLLIFTNGKIVLAGAKSRQQIYKAYHDIFPVLYQFSRRTS